MQHIVKFSLFTNFGKSKTTIYIVIASFKPDGKFTYFSEGEFHKFYVRDPFIHFSFMEHSPLPIIDKLVFSPLKGSFFMLLVPFLIEGASRKHSLLLVNTCSVWSTV